MTDPHKIKITFLGTGTSTGVPVLGCTCEICTSTDPRDKRLRCSAFIEVNGLHLLIDSGPDFRYQAMRAQIKQVDAVLYTHHHYDHVFGMEDLRPYFFYNPHPIPCYVAPNVGQVLQTMFGYIFQDGSYPGVPKMVLRSVSAPFEVSGRYSFDVALPDGTPLHQENTDCKVSITPIPLFHGALPIYGYRIGNMAYLTDTSAIPESSMTLLKGLDLLVLDALRPQEHHSHFSIAQAIEAATQIGAKRTYFIHMTHQVLHEREEALLPSHIRFAFDGLMLETA
ncbi:MAG: MBL fold metallo-hydrolase [Bacteroidetes Order II. Incertae sedis bacterium]|nr:MBL fold metallo-hydrolase [Bacteroidetes Order II. bacterium]